MKKTCLTVTDDFLTSHYNTKAYLTVTDVSHAFSVDPDQIISGQDPAVSSEGSAGRNGSDDKSVGSVVFDVDLIGKV